MSNQRYTPEFKDEAARQIVDILLPMFQNDLACRRTAFTVGS